MLLGLNTCGSTASVALGVAAANKIKILATASLAVRTYSARLIPEIAAMLESRHATLRDIEAIVVVNGPGSFTGIRVGLSTAKGLAEGAGIPLIAVSRLALLAGASGLPHVLAAMDAGRGEYYVGEYQNGQNLGEVLLERRGDGGGRQTARSGSAGLRRERCRGCLRSRQRLCCPGYLRAGLRATSRCCRGPAFRTGPVSRGQIR